MLVSQPRAASQLFETWLNDHPDDTDALLGRGLAEYLTGDYAASASTFSTVRQAQPGRIAARVDEALALEAASRLAPAIARWNEILGMEIDPGLRSAIETRLKILGSAGNAG